MLAPRSSSEPMLAADPIRPEVCTSRPMLWQLWKSLQYFPYLLRFSVELGGGAATKARSPALTHKKRVTAPFVCIVCVALPLKLSGSLHCLRPLHGLTLSGRGSRPRQLHDRPIVKATDRQTRPYARCPHPHVAHAISRQLPFAQGASTGVGYANGKSRGLVISSDVRKVANNAQMLAISPESRVVNGFLQDSDRLNDNLVRHCCVSRV
jgi:hypothetical protein